MKKSFLIVVLILISSMAEAGVSTYMSKYLGAQINNSAPALKVYDDFFATMLYNPTWQNDFTNQSVKNRIRLVYTGGEKKHDVNTTSWTATVTFDVEVRDETNTVISTLTSQTLSLSNDPSAKTTTNEAVLELLTNGYSLSISNFSVSGFPSNLVDFELIAEIETERYFKLDYSPTITISHTALTPVSSSCTSPSTWDKKLMVYWSYVIGAEEYELEWYFNSDENSTQYTTGTVSSVPTINWTRITTTNQYYEINLPFDEGNVFYRLRPVGRFYDTDPTKNFYAEWTTPDVYAVHNDEEDKNWKYNAAYAEDGKVKEIISFFDGTGRNRQTVTRLSTEDVAVVTETFYDYEGRPVIQTLPAPDADNSQNLNFYCNYSLNSSNDLLSKVDYDNFPDCDLNAPDLGVDNGASRYYSSSNVEKNEGENQVIPNAENYPYTQTVYGRDGRVKYQSMPGSKHSITENGTVTDNRYEKYAYATPLQYKLDRLFGNEVGYASHYKVKSVEDANGQTSLTYMDLSDKVVATSLIGSAPSNLDALPSNTGSATIQADFNNLNNYSPSTESYIINSSFLVEVPGPHTFNYSLTPEVVSSLCSSPTYGCVYDLEITIYDDCDRKIYDSGTNTSGDPYDDQYNSVLHVQYITLNTSTSTTGDFVVNFNKAGTYSIKKELKLNQDALDDAVADFTEYYAANCITSSDLPIDDDDCLNCDDFCELYPDSCSEYGGCEDQYKSCDILLEDLKADMSPGGQYFDNLGANSGTANAWLEYFVLTDASGDIADFGFINPTTSNLIDNWDDLRTYWQPGWEEAPLASTVLTNFGIYIDKLVEAHPEYCHYTACVALEESSLFDQSMSIQTDVGSFGTGSTSYTLSNCSTLVYTIANADPFFDGTISTGFNASNMLNGPPYADLGSGTTLADNIDDIITTTGQSVSTLDDAWPFIKAAYLERKHLWVKDYKESNDCYYLLDWSPFGSPDNLAESFLSPAPGIISPLNVDAYNYYDAIFYNMDPILTDYLHDYYFSGFHIREPDYLDFINNGIGASSNVLPSSFPNFASAFGNNVNTPCNQMITNSDCFLYETPSPSGCSGIIPYDGNTYSPDCLIGWTDINGNSSDFYNHSTTPYLNAHNSYNNTISEAFSNKLAAQVLPGKTYTLTFDARSGSATVSQLLISFSDAEYFDSDLTSGTYGPQSSNSEEIMVANSSGQGTNIPTGPSWTSISVTWTSSLSVPADYMIVYMSNATSELNAKDFVLYEDCDPISFDCFCTQLDMAEQQYVFDNSVTYPLTGSDLTSFASDLASHYNTIFPNISPDISDTDILGWRGQCFDPTGSPYEREIPDEINCDNEDSCLQQSVNITNYYNDLFDQQAMQQAINDFIDHYKAECFGGTFDEDFTIEYNDYEYHHTLYYYDRAGNLERTVPPQGVDELNATEIQAVNNHRILPSTYPTATYPDHTFETRYSYNSLNQLIEQSTPDGGTTVFFYDDIGRLKASQNDKQAAYSTPRYSYTKYDAQGRITEVGELESSLIPGSSELNDTHFPQTWIGSNDRYQVTYTNYDETLSSTINNLFGSAGQENLRNRISSIYYKEVSSDANYAYASHYSYDIHGNVKKLILDNPTQAIYSQQYRTFDYEYDLVSGNVNKVSYQKGKTDEYHHKYTYDADNRIIKAFTSKNDIIWNNDAEYFYYLHGPLARTQLGDEEVQGTDYAYTIHGWLKGVNTNNIDAAGLESDIGKDGIVGATYPYYTSVNNVHDNIARDAFGFNLSYYDGDYTSITTNGDNFLTDISSLSATPTDLFNGNISQMATSLMDNTETMIETQATNYTYDQLNRITSMEGYTASLANNDYSHASTNQYNTLYAYDANGNIGTLNRKATSNAAMDDLTYYYYDDLGNEFNPLTQTPTGNPTNKLAHVDDGDGFQSFNDLDDQSSGNYDYDEIGNLIQDDVEEIDNIEWTVYGKIKEIIRGGASTKDGLAFKYDAGGNRIRKTVKNYNDADESEWEHYHYIRDANGNIMAVYKQDFTNIGTNLWQSNYQLVENTIYGSSRIGNDTRDMSFTTVFSAQIGTNDEFEPVTPVTVDQSVGASSSATVLTDGTFDVSSGSVSTNFVAIATNPTTISGGPFTNVTGTEDYDSDYITVDANEVVTFTTSTLSSYTTDPNTEVEIMGDNALTVQAANYLTILPVGKKITKKYENISGNKVYELTNHLGNVLATITDRKISEDDNSDNTTDYYTADVKSYSDYYPFGQLMPGRYTGGNEYRYGFQGQEGDPEIKGEGNSWNYKYRMHDPRIGRFFATDPLTKKYPYLTPYQFSSNQPIHTFELEGLESNDELGQPNTSDDGSGVIKDDKTSGGVEFFKSLETQAKTPSAKQNNYGEWPLNTLGSGDGTTTTTTPFRDRVRKKYRDTDASGNPIVFNKSYRISQGATFSVNTKGFDDRVEIQSGGSTVLDVGPGPFNTEQDPNNAANVPHPNAVNGNINVNLNTLYQQGLIQNNIINIRVTPGPQQPTRFDYTLTSPTGAILSNWWNLPFGLPINN